MLAFTLRRAIQAIGVMIAVGIISFSMFRFAGDPVNQIVSLDTPAAEREALVVARQQGRELMDDAGGFGGQGGQREGSPDPEGTGYTGNSGNMSGSSRDRGESRANEIDDGSTTDDTESENPAA